MSKEQLTNKQVNLLLIDVEGFNFDVLQGESLTPPNTEYVELEFYKVGKWGSEFKKVKEALGFTFYWAGRSKLWRITECWQPHHVGAFWSYVA